MSDEIDPQNLGEPVYKPDQCITLAELDQWIQIFETVEAKLMKLDLYIEASIAHRMHLSLGDMQLWVKVKKPPLKDFDVRKYKTEGDKEHE